MNQERLLLFNKKPETEVSPAFWTHHLMIGKQEEIDGEQMGQVCQAARFFAGKP